MKNPLLETGCLPPFDRIKPEHIEPALDTVLAENLAAIEKLTSQTVISWETVLSPMEVLNDRLSQLWSPVGHLHGVADSKKLRKAYNSCLPKLSDYSAELGQNESLYQAYRHVADSPEYKDLPVAAQKIIDNALRDFHLSGVDLPTDKKQRYREIKQQLSKLQTKFEENVLDAGLAWKKLITEKKDLSGLPDSTLALLLQNAQQDGQKGWLLNLDMPCYLPLMSYCDNQELRREIYEAFVTRASDKGSNAGKWDNTQVINDILALRQELANLLSLQNFAEYSLATKMANSPEEVLGFLEELAQKSRPVAEQDLQDLHTFAKNRGISDLNAWDLPYYSEKLRQHQYAISQEELRPYFPHTKVIEGLFAVVKRLYGMNVTEQKGIAVWHTDVHFYSIHDDSGVLRGQFYLDLYARKHKRGGAWMDECRIRHNLEKSLQIPVAYLTCNFTPPIGDAPALLTHQEVTTLFHEFGHGLHHMLTLIDLPSVSGINGVAWDAVELPSQFMENWCWEREALELISGHVDTGEPMGDELYQRMLAAKNFQSGMFMLRQIEFALFDFRLHLEYKANATDVQVLLDGVRQQVSVVKPPSWNRFQNGFSHIFAGGYAAGYYSYKWAEVLSSDAFSLFEEQGIFNRNTGNDFLHNVLEQGGSRDAQELFKAFRGREPKIDALLRHSGLS